MCLSRSQALCRNSTSFSPSWAALCRALHCLWPQDSQPTANALRTWKSFPFQCLHSCSFPCLSSSQLPSKDNFCVLFGFSNYSVGKPGLLTAIPSNQKEEAVEVEGVGGFEYEKLPALKSSYDLPVAKSVDFVFSHHLNLINLSLAPPQILSIRHCQSFLPSPSFFLGPPSQFLFSASIALLSLHIFLCKSTVSGLQLPPLCRQPLLLCSEPCRLWNSNLTFITHLCPPSVRWKRGNLEFLLKGEEEVRILLKLELISIRESRNAGGRNVREV